MAITQRELQISNKSYTNKDFDAVYNELLDYAEKLSKRFSPANSNESDPFVVLLKLVAFATDKINYNVDKNILERFMVSCTQERSMRELCDMLGYHMHYYESATTDVIFKYKFTGEEEVTNIQIPRFSTVTDGDSIQYVTTNIATISKESGVSEKVTVIQGRKKSLTILGSSIIQLENIINNKLYFPELYVAQNGTFVTNNGDTNNTEWALVDNLNVQEYDSKVYKFGFDNVSNQPYLEFPEWINNIIGSGLLVDYIVTDGVSGNIGVKELTTVVRLSKPENDEIKDEDITVINSSSANNGKNIETITEAYEGFKKTIGTFDTLVTCRDYANYIYNNLEEYCSNIQVADRRSDINYSLNRVEYNSYGTYIKNNVSAKTISANQLCLYPLKPLTNKTYTGLKYKNSNEDIYPTGGYDDAYKHLENTSIIKSILEDSKTISHDYKQFNDGDLLFIKDNYILSAVISTSYKVNVLEQLDIKYNIKNALIENFNSRTLDWGEEIPFSTLIDVIMAADSRITNVSLMQPDHDLEFVVYDTWDISSDKEKVVNKNSSDYKVWINYVIAKNILEGKVSLYEYDKNFKYDFTEAAGEITDNIKYFTGKCNFSAIPSNKESCKLELKPNEVIQFLAPKLITGNGIYPYGVNYYFKPADDSFKTISANADYALQEKEYLALMYAEEGGIYITELYTKDKYVISKTISGNTSTQVVENDINIISPNFDLKSNNNEGQEHSMDTDNLKNYKDSWEKAWKALNLTAPTQVADTILDTNSQIEHKITNEENIKNTIRCYWYMNNDDNEIKWTSITDKANVEIAKEYILKDDEYFFYSDLAMQSLYSFGAGTTLRLSGDQRNNLGSWSIKNPKTVDEITKDGLQSLSEIFQLKAFSSKAVLNIKVNTIITLTGGSIINFVNNGDGDFTIEDNKYKSIGNLIINYQMSSEDSSTTTTQLPDRSTLSEDYNWKILSTLDLNAGPDQEQELFYTAKTDKILGRKNTIDFYSPKAETATKSLETSDTKPQNYFKLSNLTQVSGGEKVDISYYDIDLNEKFPSIYTYTLTNVTEDDAKAIPTITDDMYIYSTIEDENSNATLTLQVPKVISDTNNKLKGVYIMIYREDLKENTGGEVVLEGTGVNIEQVNVSKVATQDSNIGVSIVDKNMYIFKINATDAEITATSITLTFKGNSTAASKTPGGIRVFITRPKIVLNYNSLLKEDLSDFDFYQVVSDKFVSTSNVVNNSATKFYSLAEVDSSKQIDLSKNCRLEDPAAFLNYNNVANKWVLGKIDFEKSSFEIASNCKLYKN